MNKFLTFAILLCIFTQCQKRVDPQQLINETKTEFVPDKRTGVFSIEPILQGSNLLLRGETDNNNAHQALLKKLKDAGYIVTDSIIALPYGITQPWGVVSLSVANLRIDPSHDAEMVTQALMGTPVKILKEEDDWAYVQTPDKYLSWCEKDAITFFSEQEFSLWKTSRKVIVKQWYDFLKDSASNQVVSDIVAGCILKYSSESKQDVFLVTPDGRKGKTSKQNVEDFNSWKNNTLPSAEKLIATAKTFMGTPYLWGGASIKAADCSGFVKTVYFLNGCILSRDASQQAEYGKNITIDAAHSFMPGDLVFFGRKPKDNKPAKVTHVGMFIGNTEFIHSSGKVKINSFDSTRANYSQYRTISLLKVRRIIENPDTTGIATVKNHPWY
ncbi:MAG TPA: C40 family peptidase [Bacteroidales bacterium]|nr:C40 family peptidase [Bacteroidales bacterium]